MHLAYRKDTPIHIKKTFHSLATNDIRGPNLAIEIPDSIDITAPSLVESALDRMLNYDKNDIDMSLFDGYHTMTHTPSDWQESTDDIFARMSECLATKPDTRLVTEFHTSIHDTDCDFGNESGKARRVLAQAWNECTDMADFVGPNGVRELERVLDEFRNWTRKQNQTMPNDGPTNLKIGKQSKPEQHTMAGAPYRGTGGRIYNTKK